jgi:hypothetical protein
LKNSYDATRDLLPPYLNNTDPLEPEDLPLQLALLTGEVARIRQQLTAIAIAANPDSFLESFEDASSSGLG